MPFDVPPPLVQFQNPPAAIYTDCSDSRVITPYLSATGPYVKGGFLADCMIMTDRVKVWVKLTAPGMRLDLRSPAGLTFNKKGPYKPASRYVLLRKYADATVVNPWPRFSAAFEIERKIKFTRSEWEWQTVVFMTMKQKLEGQPAQYRSGKMVSEIAEIRAK